jgi:AcrR family transcriptional regulator
MPPPVKPRAYDSPRRREQAAATRELILDAARRLFAERGYAAASVGAVATEAGVAPRTVYLAFDSKANLLRGVWHRALRGERDDVPIPDQPWYRAVLAEPDPERQLRLGAENAVAVKRRVGRIFAVIRGGALVDPDVAGLWERIQTEFHANQGAVVETIAAKGALREGLDAATATDLLWTLNHPDVWHLLVEERGWSPESYEAWLVGAVCSQLLGRPAAGP